VKVLRPVKVLHMLLLVACSGSNLANEFRF